MTFLAACRRDTVPAQIACEVGQELEIVLNSSISVLASRDAC